MCRNIHVQLLVVEILSQYFSALVFENVSECCNVTFALSSVTFLSFNQPVSYR